MHLPTTSKLMRFAGIANVLGLPAIVVPVGAVDGPGPAPRRSAGAKGDGGAAAAGRLPVGLQLIGPPWRDASVLRAGCLLEAALRGAGLRAPLPARRMPSPLAPCGRGSTGAENGAAAAH
jgi:Asp-tRNA(Asn)/Glu-tRNA(Gln) amidotransferase A subunit family amidase